MLRLIGLRGGGSFAIVKNHLIRLGLDPEFIKNKSGIGCNKNRPPKYSLKEIMIENSTYFHNSTLKRRILKEGLIEYKCAICGQEPYWNGSPMILILDHINGINNDHRLENLRFVCGNCDLQLPTSRGKNIKKE